MEFKPTNSREECVGKAACHTASSSTATPVLLAHPRNAELGKHLPITPKPGVCNAGCVCGSHYQIRGAVEVPGSADPIVEAPPDASRSTSNHGLHRGMRVTQHHHNRILLLSMPQPG